MKNAPTTGEVKQGVISNEQKHNSIMASLRSAINQKCRERIYFPLTGSGSKSCPFYGVKPKSIGCISETENALENSESAHNARVFDVVKVLT